MKCKNCKEDCKCEGLNIVGNTPKEVNFLHNFNSVMAFTKCWSCDCMKPEPKVKE